MVTARSEWNQIAIQSAPAAASGDDIWRELVLDMGNPVPEEELALLEPLDLQDVGRRGTLQRLDRRIEVAMLLAQPSKLRPQLGFFLLGHTCRSVSATLSCGPSDGHVNNRCATDIPAICQ